MQITVMIVDGQGGGLGKTIVEKIKKAELPVCIIAVGTNSAATVAMVRSGANDAATGENAVVFNAARADFIVGGVGIIAANAMLGEISEAMANAISSSAARKLLIPTNKCNLFVAGVRENGLGEKIDEAVEKIRDCIDNLM